MRLASLEDTVGRPICAFEIKGPCLDILGTPARTKKRKASGYARQSALQPEKVSAGTLSNRFNFIFNAVYKDPDISRDYVAGDGPAISPSERDEPAVGSLKDSGSVDDEEDEIEWPIPEDGAPSNSAYRPVAQALTYALSVTSGCTFLYNYQVGFALEVEKVHDSNTVHVRVSRPFYRDDVPAPLDARVALAIHGISREKTDNGLPLFIRNMANMIRDYSTKEDTASGGPATENEGNTSNQDSRGTKRARAEAQNRNHPSPRFAKKSATHTKGNSEDCSRCGLQMIGMSSMFSLAHAMPSSTPVLTTHDLNRQQNNGIFKDSISHCTIDTDCISISDARKLKHSRVLGSGKSGTVSEAVWNGVKVAVKEWNGGSQEGLEDLFRELSIMRIMMKQSQNYLGLLPQECFLIMYQAMRNNALVENLCL